MSYSAAFLEAVALVLKHEGGYVNDPRDPGGETNFGISKKAYPHEDIAALTVERATALYHRDYWQAMRGDELPFGLALAVFDMAVNAGTGAAIRLLQRALRVTEDGKLGPVTLRAAQGSGLAAVVRYTRVRITYYATLRGWPHFGASWTQRSLETLVLAVRGVRP